MELRFAACVMLTLLASGICLAVRAAEQPASVVAALLEAYPGFLDRVDGNVLVWKDGTRMRIDDGKGDKPFEAMLDDPDIKDMFAMTYPAGDKGLAPELNFDPGRIRYLPLFTKMYGDCRATNLVAKAGKVVWLKTQYGKSIGFSKINGAAAQLQKVSDELDQ